MDTRQRDLWFAIPRISWIHRVIDDVASSWLLGVRTDTLLDTASNRELLWNTDSWLLVKLLLASRDTRFWIFLCNFRIVLFLFALFSNFIKLGVCLLHRNLHLMLVYARPFLGDLRQAGEALWMCITVVLLHWLGLSTVFHWLGLYINLVITISFRVVGSRELLLQICHELDGVITNHDSLAISKVYCLH